MNPLYQGKEWVVRGSHQGGGGECCSNKSYKHSLWPKETSLSLSSLFPHFFPEESESLGRVEKREEYQARTDT
jgi:hypothetical protein